MSLILITVFLLIIVLFLLYKVSTKNFDYWKKKKVKYLPPVPLFGSYKNVWLMKSHLAQVTDYFYKAFPNEPYVGTFFGNAPTLIVRDPEILKLIFTKDFYYFSSRGIVGPSKEPLTKHLFATDGDLWKVLRQNLSPLFTSAKMKNMFHLMVQCGSEFENYLKHRTEEEDQLELRDLTSRMSMDVIGSCAFGLQMNSMGKEETQFRKYCSKFLTPSIMRGIRTFFSNIIPRVTNFFGIRLIDPSITKFFLGLSRSVIEERGGRPTERHDFVDLLVQLRKKGYIEGDGIESMKPGGGERNKVQIELTDEILGAQSFVFFFAGFETSSATMSFALHELAFNPNLQRKLQDEIDTLLKKHNGKLTYELVQEARYLEKVIDETSRKYPVLMVLTRECTNNYTMPDGTVIEKGVKIHIPVNSLHHDPKYFPNPDVFDPDRFDSEIVEQRHQYCYLPFGEGQRICIGMRFGKMQVSVGLISILRNYNVEPCSKSQRVIELEPKLALPRAKNGIWMKLTPRTN